MNTNGLRIGNFISGQNDPPMRVVSISTGGVDLRFDGVDEDYGDWSYDDDELHPIDLTPEILERCGFEKKKEIKTEDGISTYYNFYFKEKLGFLPQYYMGGSNILVVCEVFAGVFLKTIDFRTNIKHLHQLQNFYFALIGEELKVNLSEPVLST